MASEMVNKPSPPKILASITPATLGSLVARRAPPGAIAFRHSVAGLSGWKVNGRIRCANSKTLRPTYCKLSAIPSQSKPKCNAQIEKICFDSSAILLAWKLNEIRNHEMHRSRRGASLLNKSHSAAAVISNVRSKSVKCDSKNLLEVPAKRLPQFLYSRSPAQHLGWSDMAHRRRRLSDFSVSLTAIALLLGCMVLSELYSHIRSCLRYPMINCVTDRSHRLILRWDSPSRDRSGNY